MLILLHDLKNSYNFMLQYLGNVSRTFNLSVVKPWLPHIWHCSRVLHSTELSMPEETSVSDCIVLWKFFLQVSYIFNYFIVKWLIYIRIKITYINKGFLSFSYDTALFFCIVFSCSLVFCISDPFVVSAFAMTFEYFDGQTCESFTNSEQFSLGFITTKWVFLVIWEASILLAVVATGAAALCSSCWLFSMDLDKIFDIFVELLGFKPMSISLSVWKID